MNDLDLSLKLLSDVNQYCIDSYADNKNAQQYLADRGLTQQSIDKWQLGYCPFDLNALKQCTDDFDRLIESKIVFEKEDSDPKYGSFVRNSISFPFYDAHRNLIAMSFRPLVSEDKRKELKLLKYWHTSFAKSTFLYGLDQAISAIREHQSVIVAEGQFDVIMAHQHGLCNTVGVGGTALSENHIQSLGRYASEIIVLFDGDQAGEQSKDKIMRDKRQKYCELLRSRTDSNVDIRAVSLPAGEDLDSYIRAFGQQALSELMTV